MFLAPPADGLVTHLQTMTDFAVIQALCKQFHSLEPTLLQSHEVAPNASRIAHAGLDTAKLNFLPLYYARFSRTFISPVCMPHCHVVPVESRQSLKCKNAFVSRYLSREK